MSPEHATDGHKTQQAHEEIAHAAGRAADIRHLAEHDLELVHHLLPDPVHVTKVRAVAQHRFGKVETLAHGGFHCTTMRLVKGMNLSHGISWLARVDPNPTVTGGVAPPQSIVAAVQRKKIYCKACAYR
ncbi:hypothetical protein CQ12_07705 [Bradyrhizobium jicamae]|uniref:Uncharacterized protein n=1 Tax=Bradyrhizobium jicamae TaxID=280332 RepID=A0A0R3MBH3_9BRAD|nr:hypothetical protein CQ12_07705 [Bradyrhizobium jicamae]